MLPYSIAVKKLQNISKPGLKNGGVIIQKSLSEKKYFKIKINRHG